MPDPLSRRHLLCTAAALPYAWHTLAFGEVVPAGRTPRWVLLGTDKGEGMYRASWDENTGKLGPAELIAATDRPDFFALHPSLPVLYTVNSVSGEKAGVSAYAFDRDRGTLQLLNRLPTHGDGPCAVSADRTGKSVFAANYTAGSLSAFSLAPDGFLAENVGVFRYTQAQHGPVADRQEAAHLHCTVLSPGNDFVVVCDLGDDVLLLFPINPGRDSSISAPLRVPARAGSGPRHVAFHPNGRWMYCIHELDCTIDLYDWTPGSKTSPAKLREGSMVSTLAPGRIPHGDTACELSVSDDGRLLYACTRGENSLAVFRIDATTGLLTPGQHLSCGGVTPRYFAFDPSRRWLLCCNQGDSTVTIFAHDRGTGHLDPAPQTFRSNTPMFCVWV